MRKLKKENSTPFQMQQSRPTYLVWILERKFTLLAPVPYYYKLPLSEISKLKTTKNETD